MQNATSCNVHESLHLYLLSLSALVFPVARAGVICAGGGGTREETSGGTHNQLSLEKLALIQLELGTPLPPVSFLHAPGYARITTIFPHNHLEDASAFKDGALQLVVRNGLHTLVGSKYAGFKVAISSTKAARHHGGHELFGMYKANFEMGEVHKQGVTTWDTLTIPFKKFSSDWSDFTGECATRDPDGYQHQCCETGTEHI